jgi:uncharacterized protein (DUF362 family)
MSGHTQETIAASLQLPPLGAGEMVSVSGIPPGSSRENIRDAVRLAALAATDFAWLKKGDSVFIKIALNSGHRYPATTSPDAVYAVASLLKEKGARRVIVGDMSGIEYLKLTPEGTKGSTRRLMKKCGMTTAVEEAGAEKHFFEEAGWNGFYPEPPVAGGNWKSPLMVPNILREVDHIVLLPRCGRHIIAGATLGLKAAVGYMRTDTRLEYHRDAATLQEKTAEANFIAVLKDKQRLTLTLADKVLTTLGPDFGYVASPETGIAFASTSVVAHDMVSLAWLLENLKNNTPAVRRAWPSDPYQFPLISRIANRVVVWWLDRPLAAFSAERFEHQPIKTIWDDRALNRAFHLLGGVPRLCFEPINQEAAEPSRLLADATRPPA